MLPSASRTVTDDEIQEYYEANESQFETPGDPRHPGRADQDRGRRAEGAHRSAAGRLPKGWEQVTKKYSIDEATKSTGGLRQRVVAGQSEPALDEQIFSAPEGELVGPFNTNAGFYVIQVEKITRRRHPTRGRQPGHPADAAAAKQQQIATELPGGLQRQVARADLVRRRLPGRSLRQRRAGRRARAPRRSRSSSGRPTPVPSRPVIQPGTPRHAVLRRRPAAATPLVPGPAPSRRRPGGDPPPESRRRRPGAAPPRHRAAARRPAPPRARPEPRRPGGCASAPRRDHSPPAARVPMGPRAGRALDRPSHRRGGLRARRRSRPRRRREAARRARRRPLPGPLPGAAARGARRRRPRRGRRDDHREADPPPSARLRRGRGRDGRRGAANWDRIKRDVEGRGGTSRTCPRTCPACCTRASCCARPTRRVAARRPGEAGRGRGGGRGGFARDRARRSVGRRSIPSWRFAQPLAAVTPTAVRMAVLPVRATPRQLERSGGR